MTPLLSTSIHVGAAIVAAIVLLLVVTDTVMPGTGLGSIIALLMGVRIATEIVQRRMTAQMTHTLDTHKE